MMMMMMMSHAPTLLGDLSRAEDWEGRGREVREVFLLEGRAGPDARADIAIAFRRGVGRVKHVENCVPCSCGYHRL